jgi:hypothetical protein
MPLYLVIHTPRAAPDEMVHAPTRLRELASASKDDDVTPRWLRTWSPDLNESAFFRFGKPMARMKLPML